MSGLVSGHKLPVTAKISPNTSLAHKAFRIRFFPIPYPPHRGNLSRSNRPSIFNMSFPSPGVFSALFPLPSTV